MMEENNNNGYEMPNTGMPQGVESVNPTPVSNPVQMPNVEVSNNVQSPMENPSMPNEPVMAQNEMPREETVVEEVQTPVMPETQVNSTPIVENVAPVMQEAAPSVNAEPTLQQVLNEPQVEEKVEVKEASKLAQLIGTIVVLVITGLLLFWVIKNYLLL